MQQQKPRLFSGMQPTGELHLGNYLGALKNWVAIADRGENEPIYCIVDAHAITVEYEPQALEERILETAISYLAAGMDPDKVTLFVQSDVRQHTELAWYLSCVTPMGDLHRMTQFKEKSDQHKTNVNAGLFTYPILMAADILLYRAAVVPVGDDQIQHLELAREIARRFNARFGEVFPEPKPILSKTPRIMGLDGKGKMSKSRGNALGLFTPAKEVEKKLKSAFTDPDKLRLGDPGKPEICNVFTMHQALTPAAEVEQIDVDCRSGALPCGTCKKRLIESVNQELDPIRTRAAELRANRGELVQLLRKGATRAGELAESTMVDVRKAMGLGSTRL